jgi:hypothetical protein
MPLKVWLVQLPPRRNSGLSGGWTTTLSPRFFLTPRIGISNHKIRVSLIKTRDPLIVAPLTG